MGDNTLSFEVGSVWCGNAANRYVFSPSNYLERHVEVENAHDVPEQTFCLQLSLQKQNHSFGILGCQYVPDTSRHLLIRVGVTEDASEYEVKNTGLNDRYANAVMYEALLSTQMNSGLGAGTLTFDRAATHTLYSNPRIFRILTRSLMLFISTPFECMDQLEAQQIIHTAITTVNKHPR
jgi:hypothetical protein